MRALLALLLLSSCAGCIFGNGFDRGCPVIIGYGSFYYTTPTIGGSAAGAAFLSTTDELFDGQPSTETRCQFVDGPITSASYVRIGFTINTQDGSNPSVGVIAAVNIDLPVGTAMKVYDAASYPAPGSLLGSTFLKPGNDGVTSGWVVLADNVDTNAVFVDFVNTEGSIAANQEFIVGELAAFTASEWDMKRDSKMSYAQTANVRLSAANVQFPVMSPSVRNFSVNLSPVTQKAAFDGGVDYTIDIASLCTAIFNADVIAFIPFLNFDPAYYGASSSKSTPDIVCKTAYLAQLTQPPSITGDGDQFYNVNFEGQESR